MHSGRDFPRRGYKIVCSSNRASLHCEALTVAMDRDLRLEPWTAAAISVCSDVSSRSRTLGYVDERETFQVQLHQRALPSLFLMSFRVHVHHPRTRCSWLDNVESCVLSARRSRTAASAEHRVCLYANVRITLRRQSQ